MLVRFPYLRDAAVIDEGRRNPSHVVVGGWHDVEITELSRDDAPAAVAWSSRRENPVRYETRWFDGRHWQLPGSRSGLDRLRITVTAAGGSEYGTSPSPWRGGARSTRKP